MRIQKNSNPTLTKNDKRFLVNSDINSKQFISEKNVTSLFLYRMAQGEYLETRKANIWYQERRVSGNQERRISGTKKGENMG